MLTLLTPFRFFSSLTFMVLNSFAWRYFRWKKATQKPEEHNEFVTYFLKTNEVSFENFTELIGDSDDTNQLIEKNSIKWLIGCASYRFNLSMKEIVANEENAVHKVHALTIKLRRCYWEQKCTSRQIFVSNSAKSPISHLSTLSWSDTSSCMIKMRNSMI